MTEEYKERIQENNKEISDQMLREKIRKLRQERERLAEPSPFRPFNRLKLRELDEKIERMMKELGV